MFFFLKILFAAIVIAFASWLSGKKPELSGFIIALPLASLMALIFSYLEHKNPETSITFAKSILVGVPVSYLFFLPFFFCQKSWYEFLAYLHHRHWSFNSGIFCSQIYCIFVLDIRSIV